jgi:hypothetical protein
MKFFELMFICLLGTTGHLVHAQELTFVEKDEWGSGSYSSVTKIKENYYASSSFSSYIDVIDPSKTGSEALVAQLSLGTSDIYQIEVYGEYLVVVAEDGLSIYSVNNATELTLEYFLAANTKSLIVDALYIGDTIVFIDNDRVVTISDNSGEFSIESVINYRLNNPQPYDRRTVNMDDNYIYLIYNDGPNNELTENIFIDKYDRNEQTLVKQYAVADTHFTWLEKIANGQFIVSTNQGLTSLDVNGNEAITVVSDYNFGFNSRVVINNNIIYVNVGASLYSFTLDENLNINSESRYDFPQFSSAGEELKWIDNKIIHSDRGTGLLEFEISQGTVNNSRYLYNQSGDLGRGIFIGESYFAPRDYRVDELTFDENNKAVKQSDFPVFGEDLYRYKDDILVRQYSGLQYRSADNWLGIGSISNFGGYFTFNDDFAFAQHYQINNDNIEFDTIRINLSTPYSLLETANITAAPKNSCFDEPLVALPTKLVRFNSCENLAHIYNSTSDDFSFIKSVPYTHGYIERIATKGEYFYIVDPLGIHVYSLTDDNELHVTSFIYRRIINSVVLSEVHDDYLFVLTQFQMFIYDVSDAAAPRYISTVDYSDNDTTPPKVSLSGDKLALTFSLISKVRFYDLNRAPVTQQTNLTVDEDSSINFSHHFTDNEEDQLSFELVTEPNNGRVNFDNGAHYIPNENFYGIDEFTVKVIDEHGNFIEQILTVNITPVNDTPYINGDEFTVNEDETLQVQLSITDIENDEISLALKQTANHGQVDVNDTGQLSYQPNDNFFGSDQLTLLLSDNQGGSQSVTLTITVEPVNDVPNFELEKYSVDEDTSYTGQLYATDIEQHDIIFGVVIGSVFQGEVIITTDGQFTFTPDQDFFGFASFDAQVIDSAQGIRQQTIAILVNPVDDIPVFDELTVAVNHNGKVSDNLPTKDIDGDVLEYTLAEDVTNGSLTFNNGEYSYSPNSGFSGSDSFSFEVTDGSNIVTSTILFSVQAAPLVNNPSPSVTESTPSKSGGSVHYFYLILLFISFWGRKRLFKR